MQIIASIFVGITLGFTLFTLTRTFYDPAEVCPLCGRPTAGGIAELSVCFALPASRLAAHGLSSAVSAHERIPRST